MSTDQDNIITKRKLYLEYLTIVMLTVIVKFLTYFEVEDEFVKFYWLDISEIGKYIATKICWAYLLCLPH